MSIINQRDFTNGFPVSDASPYGSGGSGSALPGALASPSDAIRSIAGWPNPYQGGASYQNGACQDGGFGSGTSSTGGFGTFVSELVSTLQSALANLSQMFSGSGSSGASGSGERFVNSATANSVGDPHDSLHGTTANGATLSNSWDSMAGHADLLDSDSFDGGYNVATTVTQPDAKGVTLNASATVTTQNGASSVTFNRDGSYGIVDNGANVVLQRGQSTSLGDGERVTVNDDSSVTVSDRNATGGSISTTMRTNGDGGVDVTNSADNVDLGGYLVNHSDAPPVPPIVPLGGQSSTYAPYAPQTAYDGGSIQFA